ncbi:wingless-type MMTV integration site family, member 2 [Paragonimus westermani]|uniref:Protein Wnt n=1 Tax=Paragonimus westermani TaxID=34504 RepID=A0A5J4P2M5_9TREM|nr:wingless-type MMTV integration site family, member 2 [Paragonimus westermani]
MDFSKSVTIKYFGVQTGSVHRSIGAIIVFLTCGLTLFQPGQGGIGLVAAGSWFFDLIALAQPQSSTVANNPFIRSYVQPTQTVDRLVTANQAHSLQPGRKSVRETSDSKVSRYRVTPKPFLGQTTLPSFHTFPHLSSNLAYVEPSGKHELDVKRPVTDRSNLLAQETAICHALTGLTTHQRKICMQHSGLVWAMLEGTHLGLHECVHQFQHEQWNCSAVNVLYRTQPDSIQMSSISGLEGILQRGSRETAFLSSAWSAGVVQAITRACSRGQMGTCDCDPLRRDGQDRDADGVFTWGGCSDPIKFGMRLTRLFLDANDREHRNLAIRREEELHGPRFATNSVTRRSPQHAGRRGVPDRYGRYARSSVLESISNNSSQRVLRASGHLESGVNQTAELRTPRHRMTPQELQAETLRIIQTKARVLMNIHNRRAGRNLVWKNRVRKCKCHGVSGACSMRTCWQRVNEFRRVGILLKAAYDEAVRVTYEPRRDTLRPLNIDRFESPVHGSYPVGRVLNRLSINRQDRLLAGASQPTWLIANERRHGITDHQSVRQTDENRWRKRRWPRGALETGQLSKSKMIYLEESPNYCRFDPTIAYASELNCSPRLKAHSFNCEFQAADAIRYVRLNATVDVQRR